MESKRLETFTPGPWFIKPRQLFKRDGYEWYTRTTILDDPAKAYSQRHVIAQVARSNGREDANAALIAAAPDMYAGNEDAMITLDLMAQTGGLICAECPWGKKCKTCALSEILRLEIGLRRRIENIQKKARGEKNEMES